MLRRINFESLTIILFAVILLGSTRLSYADGNSFTVNVPNSRGGYTAVVIQQSGAGYIGPQGEYYSQFPTVAQLQAMYGSGNPNPTVVAEDTSQVEVTVAPPALPVYVQPDPPGDGYIWTPGYWAYDSFFEDYYWVPGTWVRPPSVGLLWTPGYWGWSGGRYVFNDGYWGTHIGFYGGINYGWGYGGHGYNGGSWNNGTFVRNTNVTNITNKATINNSSFNGGPGGIQAKPTPEEQSAMRERHIPATAAQKTQVQAARQNPAFRASANHGKPAIAATARPGVFKGQGVVAARQAGEFYNKTKPKSNSSAPAAYHASAVQENKMSSHVQPKAKAGANPKAKPKPKVKKPLPKPPSTNGDNPQSKDPQ